MHNQVQMLASTDAFKSLKRENVKAGMSKLGSQEKSGIDRLWAWMSGPPRSPRV